jgi:hypothetical protein
LVWAVAKEFGWDYHHRLQPLDEAAKDFLFYCLGIASAVGLSFLRK